MRLNQDIVKNQIQLELQNSILERTKRDYVNARKAISNPNPTEREKAIERMSHAYEILVLFFNFGLEDLARLMDQDGDAA